MAFDNIKNPFVSPTLLKRVAQMGKEDINDLISLKSEELSLTKSNLIYMLTKSLLDNFLFYNVEQSVREWLLFESAYWASKEETRHKRPKEFSEELSSSRDRYFTKLTKSVINALIVKHNITDEDIKNSASNFVTFNFELSHILGFLYDISCIKRDRRGIDKEN